MHSKIYNKQWLKQKALELGFDYCGIAEATFLEDEAPRLEKWLRESRHGSMAWMENWFDKRLDPRKLVEGAQSVISLLLNYSPADDTLSMGPFKISRYAYGEDYHHVIKQKLAELVKTMQTEWGEFNARIFVDSAPVMDKVWAQRSGLGWIGKHSNLIHKQQGSYFFIAEIICDIKFEYDTAIKDYCGTCTRCVDACPTNAIFENYQVDGSKCISYLTIELKEEIPAEFKSQMQNWVFGCDICQEVCPWNRFSTPHTTPAFTPSEALQHWAKQPHAFEEITAHVFKSLFKKSAISRTKFEGLQRNILFVR
jgi:epoxyqueuosine reductase